MEKRLTVWQKVENYWVICRSYEESWLKDWINLGMTQSERLAWWEKHTITFEGQNPNDVN